MNERGRSQTRYCIAHIWCWPTPVVQIDVVAAGGQVAQRLDARAAASARPSARAVAERELLPPLLELRAATASRSAGRRRRAPATLGASSASTSFSGPTTGMLGVADLPDLGRVDVEVDHLRARRERRDLAGDAVVEARADGDQQVGLVQRPVRRTSSRACRASRSSAGASRGARPSPSASSTAGSRAGLGELEQLGATRRR